MSEEAVGFDAAIVRAGGRTILGPVDLRVAAGDRWVFLGPNGGGKTTLLTLAGAWRQPSAGTVRVLGSTLGRVDVRELRRRIGHVSHAVADRLRPAATVLDVVLTGKAAVLETWWQDLGPSDRRRALDLLDEMGCRELADRPLGSCSLGERQRVLIARARFGQRPLLLFDEPAAGLDLPSRERLLAAMAAVPAGTTTLLATHHLEEIPPDVTHAGLLRRGLVIASGPADEVLADGPLSDLFELEVAVERRGDRWTARAR
ncbi:MAG TPA: ATP-binding cassette domain-containing protein [Actinomycetota bacterium]|nr:ATP-binding cassette domain-containing protein [Actinomycetota bacterium]